MSEGLSSTMEAVLAAAEAPRKRRSSSTAAMAKRLGLRLATADELKIKRRRAGTGFCYVAPEGFVIKDAEVLKRLSSLAVPPAYTDVFYAEDASAHLQAIGRDAAGRMQYRYHPEWEKVREARKAKRLERLVRSLPRIRRSIAQHLSGRAPTRELALASVIELVARSSIRAGREVYAKERGTRGAATLLKSNVKLDGETIRLSFRAKGGKAVDKEISAPRLCAALEVLRQVPGRRLFQYVDAQGATHVVRARDVNAFLREMAGASISLKDFRTLCASAAVLDALARTLPSNSERGRRKQVLEAVRAAAEELHNTPTICRKSYVHETVVHAFEKGVLERFSAALKSCRSPSRKEQFLAQVIATASL
jgi:DNA topoisomerase-1